MKKLRKVLRSPSLVNTKRHIVATATPDATRGQEISEPEQAGPFDPLVEEVGEHEGDQDRQRSDLEEQQPGEPQGLEEQAGHGAGWRSSRTR